MTSKKSSDIILRVPGDQRPAPESSWTRQRSESRRLSERRPASHCSAQDDTSSSIVQVGNSIRVFSRSAKQWVDGEVVELFYDNFARIEYASGEHLFEKTVHLNSEHILFPLAICKSTVGERTPTSMLPRCDLERRSFSSIPASRDDAVKMEVARDLVGKGFTLRQLLLFYKHMQEEYDMNGSWTTERVVSDIIIPETADDQCCYMQSSFMYHHGGPQLAKKLVSHAIPTCRFLTTVLNIIFDASGLDEDNLMDKDILLEMEYGMDNYELDADIALHALSSDALATTYWLCILAINEHKALCGDCWTCRDEDNKGEPLNEMQLKMDPCKHGPKRNPCKCGMRKFRKNDPLREVDKIVTIIANFVEEVVVSMDPQLLSLKRLWILKEIFEAVKSGTVITFRSIHGLSQDVRQMLQKGGKALVPPVAECQVTDRQDLQRVLEQIDTYEGGQHAFNAFVSCMVELQYGVCNRLSDLTGPALRVLQRLQNLHMNSPAALDPVDLSELGMGIVFGKQLQNLQRLDVSFECCCMIRDISPLGDALKKLNKLQFLNVNFADCAELTDISTMDESLNELKSLQLLKLNFTRCSELVNISPIGGGLKKHRSLQHLELCFDCCQKLADVSSIGEGLEELEYLQNLQLDFAADDSDRLGCVHLRDISSVGEGLGELRNLQRLKLDFSFRSELTDISHIGAGLKNLESLQHLEMYFSKCGKLTDITMIGEGLKGLKSLQSLTMYFNSWCKLTDISSLGEGLNDLKSLRDLKMCFNGWHKLPDISIGEGFKNMTSLQRLEMHFSDCHKLADISSIGRGLKELHRLQYLCMSFCCSKLTDTSMIGEGLKKLNVLQHLEMDFRFCDSITDISAIQEGVKELECLRHLDLNFKGCSKLRNPLAKRCFRSCEAFLNVK